MFVSYVSFSFLMFCFTDTANWFLNSFSVASLLLGCQETAYREKTGFGAHTVFTKTRHPLIRAGRLRSPRSAGCQNCSLVGYYYVAPGSGDTSNRDRGVGLDTVELHASRQRNR